MVYISSEEYKGLTRDATFLSLHGEFLAEALGNYIRVLESHAETMHKLHESGGNGLVTAKAAKDLAETQAARAEEGAKILRGLGRILHDDPVEDND